ncbi:MAG: ABC-type transporter, periplasmic subunit family 3 [Gemmatimonadetes bacterium]|nr:ABC-type transporter, periplasmic subunit family 3 [Gemmatimonadota bacterium]
MAGNARADDGAVAGMLDAQRLLMISRLHLPRHELDRWWRFMPAIPMRATVALIALTASCALPRDANGTLSRVRGGVLRVGVSLNGPWTMRSDSSLTGSEVLLVGELARQLGARPVWRVGPESTLLEALEARELDLVIGGLTGTTPWAGRVALTRPYETVGEQSHVMATSPGENAWLVHVEQFLQTRPRPGGNGE